MYNEKSKMQQNCHSIPSKSIYPDKDFKLSEAKQKSNGQYSDESDNYLVSLPLNSIQNMFFRNINDQEKGTQRTKIKLNPSKMSDEKSQSEFTLSSLGDKVDLSSAAKDIVNFLGGGKGEIKMR